MSEIDRTSGYVYDRVLIETARVLDPQAPGKSVFLNAGHLEMLRNLIAYAYRKTTFVSEYQAGSYLVPSDTDWRQLLSQIAEMEYNLMTGDNVLWGFNDDWHESAGLTMPSDGAFTASTTAVPAGWVYVAQAITMRNPTGQRGEAIIRLISSVAAATLAYSASLVAKEPLIHSNEVSLVEGDTVLFYMGACLEDDVIEATVWGYKLKLPE